MSKLLKHRFTKIAAVVTVLAAMLVCTCFAGISTFAEGEANSRTELVNYGIASAEKPLVTVTYEKGFDAALELVVAEKDKNAALPDKTLETDEYVGGVYDIALKNGEEEVKPAGTVTVKLQIPADVHGSAFRLLQNKDGKYTEVEYIEQNGYAIFTTKELHEYVFVYNATKTYGWVVALIAVLVVLELGVTVYLAIKLKKVKANAPAVVKTSAFVPVFLLAAPMADNSKTLILMLIVWGLVVALINVSLYRKIKKYDVKPEAPAEKAPAEVAKKVPAEEVPVTEMPVAEADAVPAETVEPAATPRAKTATKKFAVNLDMLSANFEAGETVNLDALKAKGIVPKKEQAVKILSFGIIDKALTVEADAFSSDAVKKITAAGGTVITK